MNFASTTLEDRIIDGARNKKEIYFHVNGSLFSPDLKPNNSEQKEAIFLLRKFLRRIGAEVVILYPLALESEV